MTVLQVHFLLCIVQRLFHATGQRHVWLLTEITYKHLEGWRGVLRPRQHSIYRLYGRQTPWSLPCCVTVSSPTVGQYWSTEMVKSCFTTVVLSDSWSKFWTCQKWPKLNDVTCIWTVLNGVIYNMKKQVKQVAVCKTSKVLINTTKQQHQTNFCSS